MRILFLSLMLVWALPQPLMAKSSSEGDPLSLAALMIKDQHFYRAQEILENADTSKKKFDFKRYHTLSGITALNIEQNDKAIEHFQQAIDLGQQDEILWVYMSQAAYKKGDYAQVIAYLKNAPSMQRKHPNLLFMQYDAALKQGKNHQAWDFLSLGEGYFPKESRFLKQKVFRLIDLGYYQEAAKQGLLYTERFQPSADDYIAIGVALSKTNNAKLAARFLEAAKLRFPNDVQANKALANHYSSQKQYFTAARLMEPLANQDPELLSEAAELNKLSRQYFRALFLNSRSSNQKDKLKQRLALFLEHEEYELASLMEKDLNRNKVLEDDNVRYALAYAHFKSGKYDEAEAQLSQIRNSRLFNKANQIRSVMLDCQNNRWKCQ